MHVSFFWKFFIYLSSIYLLLSLPANAQYDEKQFIHYTVKDRLSHNYITSLQQDDLGYMWIGTEAGLNRFDGNSFTNFYNDGKPISLPSSIIKNIKKFDQHHLGVLTRNGLQIINTKDFSFRNYLIPDSTAFSPYRNQAWDAMALSNHRLAITTASGFYVFNATGEIIFRHDAYGIKDINKKRILYGRDIFSINNNEYLVFVEEHGLAYYNMKKNSFHELSDEDKQWTNFYPGDTIGKRNLVVNYQLTRDEFIFIHFDAKSILYYNKALNKTVKTQIVFPKYEFSWQSKITPLNDSTFLVNGGYYGFYIFHLNRKTGKITVNPKKFLSGYKIQSLYLDKDKRLWVGTSKGVLKQKLSVPALNSYFFPPLLSDSLTGGFSCGYRYGDKLYLGRFSMNKGLVIVDTATNKAEKQIDFYGKNSSWNEIRSMQMYHPDTLWIGTNAGLLWFNIKTLSYGKLFESDVYNKYSRHKINMLAPVKEGYAWMCGILNGTVARYHISSRTFTFFTDETIPALPFAMVKSITYDSYGDVWIGGHSLARWNTKKQIFDTLITVYGGAKKFNNDILTMSADTKGSLWLHNVENGLLEYRIKEMKFISYTMNDGLPSNTFETFSPVIQDILWMGSPNHLTRFNTVTKKFLVFDYQDGFPDESPKSRIINYDASVGKFYMFCRDYLVTYPQVIPKPAGNSSNIIIQQLEINNGRSFFNPDNNIHLQHQENNISIHFSIIDFEHNNYQFAYKLNNDENWINLNEQRYINLTSLPPGKYHLQLRTNGKQGEQRLLDFIFFIEAPFWKTMWFAVAILLLFMSMIYLLYRYRIKQIHQKANIDKQLAQTEMKALHAQMNPHFISNCLNSIREMILNNENREASHFLTKFAHLIRVTLDNSTQSFISLRNAMDYLHRYVEMEQIRNNAFTCKITSDAQLDINEIVLPPMLIQPFVENAIWHGMAGNRKSIEVNINFKKQDNQLVCIIDDNGIGIESSLDNKRSSKNLRQSIGVSNIKQRIQLLNEKYNLQSSVTIEDKSKIAGCNETGTKVTLRLPIEIIEQ